MLHQPQCTLDPAADAATVFSFSQRHKSTVRLTISVVALAAISTCAGTVCAVVLGELARASRPADSPPTARALGLCALQRFSVSHRGTNHWCASNLCCGALAARSAPALVQFAHPFLRGLPEQVDPPTSAYRWRAVVPVAGAATVFSFLQRQSLVRLTARCGALAARSAPALVQFAHPFLRGLPEQVDPPTSAAGALWRALQRFQFRTGANQRTSVRAYRLLITYSL